ncbi:NUDIX hydrolase [Lentzea sp. JNUCC 0626]|uniref:NUDIX hydrolase n=1 Tax=Lentzea sp. JNUCC 0626 TaxID=3367513 RepID=UPI003748A6CE
MIDYIAKLRALVGTMPLMLPGTSVLVSDEEGRLLLVRRADCGTWGLPGGFMEPGETFAETGVREVREETSLEVSSMALLDVFSGPEYFAVCPNGDEVHNVTAAYTAVVSRGDLHVDPAEVSAAEFFPLDSLPEDLFAPERPIVERYLADTARKEAGSHLTAARTRTDRSAVTSS